MKVAAIVPAAGKGRRIKSSVEKPYIKLRGIPVLAYTLKRLSDNRHISEIVLAVGRHRVELARRLVDRYGIEKVRIVQGGRARKDSVFNALRNVSSGADYILIHDGIRPFITDELIESSLRVARCFGASVVAVPVKATLKCIEKGGFVDYTPDRRCFWEAQTPQVFRRDLLEQAYSRMGKKKINITDDSMLVEHLGIKPKIVMGEYSNIKITTHEDLELANIIIDLRYRNGKF